MNLNSQQELSPAVGTVSVHDPRYSYMQDSSLRNLLIDELTGIAEDFLSINLKDFLPFHRDIKSEIEHFWQIYINRPFGHNQGGSGFHNAFWIYLVSRTIRPSLIVESGVWKGQTTWLFEQACPDANIHGFDINLGNLEYKTGKIKYHEQDWSEYHCGDIEANRSLIFFDCHINHAKRILEAYERGFRHLLFDDNPPLHKLYAYGLPGFPTVEMVVNCTFNNKQEVSWAWHGQRKQYRLDIMEISQARSLVEKHVVFPDVGGLTRYGGFSFLTYVQLCE